MDLFVDPGCVSVRFGKGGFGGVSKLYIIWSAMSDMKNTQLSVPQNQTVAQSLVDDDDEDELFNMIADEIRAPTWMTPILNQFPTVPRSTAISPPKLPRSEEPESTISTSTTYSSLLSASTRHSRSSSRSSSSSGSSSFQSDTTASSVSYSSFKQRPSHSRQNSTSSVANSGLLPAASLIMQAPVSLEDDDECDGSNTPLVTPNSKSSRRERVRQAHVHIDATKTDVTPYDGGKTTVLTGGVMLGMKATPAPVPATPGTPRFSATPMAVGRKTTWRMPTRISPRIHA